MHSTCAAALLLAFTLLGTVGCQTRAKDVDDYAALRTRLAAHRETQLRRLHAYVEAGQFPHNTSSPTDLHMFRDAQGRYCAVANLVHQDGRDDLVEQVVRERNDLAIHDVTESDGPMVAWILESGLTKEELERIQFPARPLRVEMLPRVQSEVAAKKPKPAPVDAARAAQLARETERRAEEAMQASVRANLAEVEAELRAHTAGSLALATKRAHDRTPSVRVASR